LLVADGELTAAFQGVAHDHDSATHCAEHQAEAAAQLEDQQVGILHRLERGESFGSCCQFEADIEQRVVPIGFKFWLVGG